MAGKVVAFGATCLAVAVGGSVVANKFAEQQKQYLALLSTTTAQKAHIQTLQMDIKELRTKLRETEGERASELEIAGIVAAVGIAGIYSLSRLR